MTKFFLNNIQDLIEIQRVSFYKFILNDIKQLLFFLLNPLLNDFEYLFYYHPYKMFIRYPKCVRKSMLKPSKTYLLHVFIPLFISDKITNKSLFIRQKILKIPLLTSSGNFLVNGCERIVINQTIKRPGIYFNSKIGIRKQKIYTATIVPSKGSWHAINLDEFIAYDVNKKYLNIKIPLAKRSISRKYKLKYFFSPKIHDITYMKPSTYPDYLPSRNLEKLYIIAGFPKKREISVMISLGPFSFSNIFKNYLVRSLCKKVNYFKFNLAYNQNYYKENRLLKFYAGYKNGTIVIRESKIHVRKKKVYKKPLWKYNPLIHIFDLLTLRPCTSFLDQNPNDLAKLNLQAKNIQKINKKIYIGHLGRQFINQRYSLNIPKTSSHLCSTDVIHILNELYNIKYQKITIKSIDHISHKQIRSVGELLYKIIFNSITKLNNKILYEYTRAKVPYIRFSRSNYIENFAKFLIKEYRFNIFNKFQKLKIKDFIKFRPEAKENLLENFNKLGKILNIDLKLDIDSYQVDQILSKRRNLRETLLKELEKGIFFINIAIKDFFSTSQLSQFADQINPLSTLTHKRRVSVFGPQGLDRDKISNKLRDIHPSQYGKICPIETPEGRNAGVVTTLALFSRKDFYEFLETPYLFLNYSKVFSKTSPLFLNGLIDENRMLSSIDPDTSAIKIKKLFSKNILSKYQNKFYHINTEYLKLLTFSSAQILSLGTSIIPFVEHNDGNRALMGANMLRQAIPCLIQQTCIVGIQTELNIALDSNYSISSYSEGKICSISAKDITIIDKYNQIISYRLPQVMNTNQLIYLKYKPIVWPMEKVYSGEIIAAGENISNGETAFGQNLTVAYMPWEGYNFEDAIVINEKLITNNILTSIHIETYDIFLKKVINIKEIQKILDNEKQSKEIINIKNLINDKYNNYGLILPGNYIYPGMPLLLRYEIKLDINSDFIKKIFKNFTPSNYSQIFTLENLISSSILTPANLRGRIVGIKHVKKWNDMDCFLGEAIRFYIVKYAEIEVGDKLSGRHGNKGVISRILSESDMPLLPDGSTLDLLLNPLGVPSRMNIGQVFECLLGITGEKLGIRYKVLPFDEIYGKNISQIIVNTFLSKMAYKLKRPWLYQKYSPGKIFVKDGRTGEYFDNSVLVGKAYILKLIHIVQDKIHARALGPYSGITDQPLKGRAKNGGQRFGEMEVWALEAHGCSLSLQELLTIKSDNPTARKDIYDYLVDNNNRLPVPNIPEAFNLLVNELRGLGLNIQFKATELNSNISIFYNYNYKKLNLYKYIESELKMIKKLDYEYFKK